MYERCDACGLKYQREAGYFLGSIYFNYGVTALLVTATYVPLFFIWEIPARVLLPAALALCILFPLWFFRYAQPVDVLGPPGRPAAARTQSASEGLKRRYTSPKRQRGTESESDPGQEPREGGQSALNLCSRWPPSLGLIGVRCEVRYADGWPCDA